MHNWILVNIIEVYENKTDKVFSFSKREFVEHQYVIGCYSCEKVRVVREDTFNKMKKLGLIEEVETV